MKKLNFLVVLAVLFALGALSAQAQTELANETRRLRGDFNGNGVVNSQDMLFLQSVIDKYDLNDDSKVNNDDLLVIRNSLSQNPVPSNLDLNGNGTVNSQDMLFLQDIINQYDLTGDETLDASDLEAIGDYSEAGGTDKPGTVTIDQDAPEKPTAGSYLPPSVSGKTGVVDASEIPLFDKPVATEAEPYVAPSVGEKTGTIFLPYTEEEKQLKLRALGVTSVNAGDLYIEGQKVTVSPSVAMEKAKTETEAVISDVVLVNEEVGEEKVPVYEVSTYKDARFLGLIKVKVEEKVNVDANTGFVTKVKSPWWSWLSF